MSSFFCNPCAVEVQWITKCSATVTRFDEASSPASGRFGTLIPTQLSSVPRASLRGPRPNLPAGSMRLGGNGAMRKVAAQKTPPHGAARNPQKPATVRDTLNEQSPEAKRRGGGNTTGGEVRGNGGRDSVPRSGVQTIERGGFGRSFRFRRPIAELATTRSQNGHIPVVIGIPNAPLEGSTPCTLLRFAVTAMA